MAQFVDDTGLLTKLSELKFDVSNGVVHVQPNQSLPTDAQTLQNLGKVLTALDDEIKRQVSDSYESLLKQASGILHLEKVLGMMQTHVQGLVSGVDLLKRRLAEPYVQMETHLRMLARLQSACDLLRRVIRILALGKKLEQQMQTGNTDIAKTALILKEISQVCSDLDLTSIKVLEKAARLMAQVRSDSEQQAQLLITKGLESTNQSQIGTALQVFHHLGILDSKVDALVHAMKAKIKNDVKSTLDVQISVQSTGENQAPKVPGKAVLPLPSSNANMRLILWTNMDKLMDSIMQQLLQVSHLQRVLVKKRDVVSQMCFMELLHGNQATHVTLTQQWWSHLTSVLCEEFLRASNRSPYLKQTFESEYPKLLKLFLDLWSRVKDSGVFSEENKPESWRFDSTLNFDGGSFLRSTLESFQTAYVSRSLSRLLDPVHLMFSGGIDQEQAPPHGEADSVLKVIGSELSAFKVDSGLGIMVCKNIAETIQLLRTKADQLVVSDADATQVVGPPTPVQVRNAGLVNLMYHFTQGLQGVLEQSGIHPDGMQVVQKALINTKNAAVAILHPFFAAIAKATESILLTMHSEDFSTEIVAETVGCSLYMKELQHFLSRVGTDYVPLYNCPTLVQPELRALASRCIELFVRHVTLIRPLGEGGKIRIANDCGQMEMALTPVFENPSELGKVFKALRSLRLLIFQSVEHIQNSPILGDILSYSTVLHFLFSKAPVELQSPHQGSGWSLRRYSEWLDEHLEERDRLVLIKRALETYAQAVKDKNLKEYAPIYSIMVSLLQVGLKVLAR